MSWGARGAVAIGVVEASGAVGRGAAGADASAAEAASGAEVGAAYPVEVGGPGTCTKEFGPV